MIAFAKQNRSRKSVPAWHNLFLAMLPTITAHARIAFRNLNPEARQDAVQEVVANAFVAFARLAELGKTELAFASVLARYGVAQFRDGRRVGNRLRIGDVLSSHAQRQKNIRMERLDKFDQEENAWQEAVVVDTRSAPVPDIVSFRLDFAEWLRRLSRRNRHVAESLAIGNRTKDVSRRFRISDGRVAQLRRELAKSWAAFRGEDGSSSVRVDPAAA
jgi:hypothetical protein